jgi:four helix bundle protein
MQRFTELKVWQRSHGLTLAIYRTTRSFPTDERFGVIAQIRRAAVSVASNIAEGSKRRHPTDYARFLNLAEGSLSEVEYLVILSRDLGYLPASTATKVINEIQQISRMLHALREKVDPSPRPS